MNMASSTRNDTVVIGAGPHGLAAVAHLRGAGVQTHAFGDPLGFWKDTMPADMILRSSPRASHISSPRKTWSLSRWAGEHGRELGEFVTLRDFLTYGDWFQRNVVPDLDARRVTRVARNGSGFAVTLSDGEQMSAARVVVAAGLTPFAHVPPAFRHLPGTHASHTMHAPDLGRFAGRRVAVVGGGQSALETAALLHELGADTEVIARAPAIYWLNFGYGGAGEAAGDAQPVVPGPKPEYQPTWRDRTGLYWRPAPTEVGGRLSSWVGAAPDVMRLLPPRVRDPLTQHCIRPAGAYWLPDRLRDVRITTGRTVVGAEERGEQTLLRLDDGGERSVDHVLLGTGYEIDVRRYPFLDETVLDGLRTRAGYPVLARGLESSVPGLHFTGALAAGSFGPTMRFIVGSCYTAPALAERVAGRRGRAFRWAF